MSDLATQIRTYLDDTAPPVTFDEVFAERIRVLPLQPTRRRPIPVRGRGPLIAIAAAVVVLAIGAATAILTLSGEGGNDVITPLPTTTVAVQALQPGPITSFEDIAGTYVRLGSGFLTFLLFFEDGTKFNASSDTDLIVDRPTVAYQTRFDGTRVFITTSFSFCDQPDRGGTYEIHVLESGNLQFVAVDEDACAARSGLLLRLRDGVPTAEYEPVPYRSGVRNVS